MKLSLNEKYTKLRKDYVKLQKEHEELRSESGSMLIAFTEYKQQMDEFKAQFEHLVNQHVADQPAAQPHCNDSVSSGGIRQPATPPASE